MALKRTQTRSQKGHQPFVSRYSVTKGLRSIPESHASSSKKVLAVFANASQVGGTEITAANASQIDTSTAANEAEVKNPFILSDAVAVNFSLRL